MIAAQPAPCRQSRSAVPDLLFDDVLLERVSDIRPYLEAPELVGPAVALHRLTVFLTYRCNLACPYCKTIARTPLDYDRFPQKRVTLTYEMFAALLDSQADAPIRHLHFTGGEATLVRDLPRMVALARARGVEHVSITSNGTASADTYRALADHGIDEIRISVDARDAERGAQLTGRARAWSMSIDTLRRLGGIDQPDRPFLIANTVVSATNREDLPAIVRFLLSIGVDDIKLITEVDARDTLGAFADAPRILDELHDIASNYPPDALPLLRRKLDTVFSRVAIGLDLVPQTKADWRCYIPLTERTVDGRHYYPCSVYLREGGSPLGSLDDPPPVQRQKTAAFVRDGRCLDDPICARYCLHCTRAFNEEANRQRDAGTV